MQQTGQPDRHHQRQLGAVDILGLSFASNTMPAGNETACRKGEYFRRELSVNTHRAAAENLR